MAKILLLGGTGFSGRATAARFLERAPEHAITLAGRNAERTRRISSKLGEAIGAVGLDWDDQRGLAAIAAEHDLVLNLAAPFRDTLAPAMDAAIEAGVPYLDILADSSQVEVAWARHDDAVAAGVTACFGMGHFPGLTSLFARRAIEALDEAHTVEIGIATAPWAYVDPGVLADHAEKTGTVNIGFRDMLEALAGPFPVLRDGAYVNLDVRAPQVPVDWPGGGIERASLTGAIEPLTLKSVFPTLRYARHLASNCVSEVDEIYRSFARRVLQGELSSTEALVGALRAMAEELDVLPELQDALPPVSLWARASGQLDGQDARATCIPTGTWAATSEHSATVDTLITAALRTVGSESLEPGVFAPEALFELQPFLDYVSARDGVKSEALVRLEID